MNDVDRAQKLIAFENERGRVEALGKELDNVPHWMPAKGLREFVAQAERILADAKERLDAKPVIAIVGPTGSGKSTLTNALVAMDGFVEVGNSRPTTRAISVIARCSDDARQLLDHIGHERIHVLPCASTAFPDALIVDTPDTDSGECFEHRALLEKTLRLSDVLLCVFDATNPKRHDNIRALASWVNTFPGKHIFLVLNRCDRIPENELTESVKPDFLDHISRSWTKACAEVFRVSARSSLQSPEWPPSEKPLHQVNDLVMLRERLQELGGGAFFADQRIDRARHLHASAVKAARDCVKMYAPDLPEIRKSIVELEGRIGSEIVANLAHQTTESSGRIASLLCGGLALRWWGPVGLYVGFWRRLVDFWTPMTMVRSLNLISVVPVLVRSIRAIKNPDQFERELGKALDTTTRGTECIKATIEVQREWPDIAERLVRNGFGVAVHNPAVFMDMQPALRLSRQVWSNAVMHAIDECAERLSRPLLQYLLNAPVLLGFLAVCVQVVWGFVTHEYLPQSFFLHAGTLLVLLWLLPSWWLQSLVHRQRKRIPQLALGHASDAAWNGNGHESTEKLAIRREVDRVMSLSKAETTFRRSSGEIK